MYIDRSIKNNVTPFLVIKSEGHRKNNALGHR